MLKIIPKFAAAALHIQSGCPSLLVITTAMSALKDIFGGRTRILGQSSCIWITSFHIAVIYIVRLFNHTQSLNQIFQYKLMTNDDFMQIKGNAIIIISRCESYSSLCFEYNAWLVCVITEINFLVWVIANIIFWCHIYLLRFLSQDFSHTCSNTVKHGKYSHLHVLLNAFL